MVSLGPTRRWIALILLVMVLVNVRLMSITWEHVETVTPQGEIVEAGGCVKDDMDVDPQDRVGAVRRAVRNVFVLKKGRVPSTDCTGTSRVEIEFAELRRRLGKRKKGCIVYLAQKRHSSYGRDSLGMLHKSIDLLYENYNQDHRDDVLVFHSGDLQKEDEVLLRGNGTRPEVFLIHLKEGSRFWELPGFIDHAKSSLWTDDAFSEGYRHMCRWYAGLLFEFVDLLGYEYVMRMDEDSYLLSKIRYNIFDFMERNDLEYGFRVDAYEPCCDLSFRQVYIQTFIKQAKIDVDKQGFYKKCCMDNQGMYNSYGYYNNFFVTKVAFWLKPEVRQLFNFIDWTGGIFLFRENDLVVQSLSVQLFMDESKVHKFTDWSYEHVSGKRCEWGAVVRGTNDLDGQAVTESISRYQTSNPNVILHNNDMYCHRLNFLAAAQLNFHHRN